jgi:hypothetical protein
MNYSGFTNSIMLYFNCLLCKQFYNIYGRYVLCCEQTAVVFISFLLIVRRWRNPTSSYIDIPDMLFFKDLKYFDPGAIYRKHKAHFLRNKFRKPKFV